MVPPQDLAPTGLAPELALQIVKQALEGGWAPGDHLPAPRLAQAFGVSPSPVREALRLLKRLEVVEGKPNRGFFLTADGPELARARDALERLDVEDEDYLTLVADRLAGRLPEAFCEAELMRRYGISRAQLQGMLMKIERNGWIEHQPGYGWAFLPVLTSERAHAQSYRFRMGLEPVALTEPAFKIDPKAFAEARRAHEALLADGTARTGCADIFETGAAFHEMLMGSAGNPFYLQALKRQNRLRRLIEREETVDAERLARQCREHLGILDLLEAGENARAARLMREHLAASSEAALRLCQMDGAAVPAGMLNL